MVADWWKRDGRVVMGNVALVAPAGTVTVAGTAAACGLLLDRITAVPPAGAGGQGDRAGGRRPPGTLVGFSASDGDRHERRRRRGRRGRASGSGAGAGTAPTVTEKARGRRPALRVGQPQRPGRRCPRRSGCRRRGRRGRWRRPGSASCPGGSAPAVTDQL